MLFEGEIFWGFQIIALRYSCPTHTKYMYMFTIFWVIFYASINMCLNCSIYISPKPKSLLFYIHMYSSVFAPTGTRLINNLSECAKFQWKLHIAHTVCVCEFYIICPSNNILVSNILSEKCVTSISKFACAIPQLDMFYIRCKHGIYGKYINSQTDRRWFWP